jgi:hypothetical protein
MGPHAWYHFGDYPGFSLAPVLDFEDPSVAAAYSHTGAPPRMIAFDEQLQVRCGYCHVDGDPRTNDLTPEGVETRLMMDLSDRFKVGCDYCHAGAPRQFTRAGKFALRDIQQLPGWKCATCHDQGFKVTHVR